MRRACPGPTTAVPAAAVLAWSLVLGWAGCGTGRGPGPVYPVDGRVLLADGRPLTGGAVQFIPAPGGLLAYGKVGADGTFSLESLDRRPGAAPGEYKVRIEPGPATTAPSKGKPRPLPFAARYLDDDGDTGLTATVRPGPTRLEPFRLDLK